jgi:hypothetical protein
MARLERMMEPMKSHLTKLPCPSFENQPWLSGKTPYRPKDFFDFNRRASATRGPTLRGDDRGLPRYPR